MQIKLLHAWALEKATKQWAWLNDQDPNFVLFVKLPVHVRAEIIQMAEDLQISEKPCES